MIADGRFAGRQLISEVQLCVNAMLPANCCSSYEVALGGNPADNFGWVGEDEDLLFAQDASLPGQYVAQWKLRAMAQGAALRKIASSKSRRILAFNNSFDIAGVQVGCEVLCYDAPSRKSSPRRRGPAIAFLLDESGDAVSFQGQTFKVARRCVRKKVRASADPEASF